MRNSDMKTKMKRPICIIIAGRPGSGKSTLATKLSSLICCPKISRDEIYEGYINSHGVKCNLMPLGTKGTVNKIFYNTCLQLLKSNVSIVIEAAFQHAMWDNIIPRIQKISRCCLIVCDISAELSAKRHLERGLKNPKRLYFHSDKRVKTYKETGICVVGGEFIPPQHNIPRLVVSTAKGYKPSIKSIVNFISDL